MENKFNFKTKRIKKDNTTQISKTIKSWRRIKAFDF